MEDVQEANLRYNMLEYIYHNRLLAESSSNYVWERFRTENIDYETIREDDLKLMFWRDVLPEIDAFELLTDDMKEYYNKGSVFMDIDETIVNSLAHNEVKGGGKDYKVCQSPDQENINPNVETSGLKVTEAFTKPTTYRGRFGFDTDSDEDENCLKIVPGKKPKLEPADEFLESLVKAFSDVLNPEGETLTLDQIKTDLADPNVLKDFDDLKNLPLSIQQFMNQFPMFKSKGQVNTDNANEYRLSIAVPSGVDDEDRNSVISSEDSATSRRSSTHSEGTDSIKQSARTRSKKNLVTGSATNKRMEDFKSKFGSSKRRRSATSPEH